MKTFFRRLAFTAFATALVVMSLPEQGSAKKPRKLPIKSYITGAKIAYGKTTGDEAPRPYDALALLDSCTMWYGMIPEVYFWETLIHSDLAGQIAKTDTTARKARIAKVIGATDSLVLAVTKGTRRSRRNTRRNANHSGLLLILSVWTGSRNTTMTPKNIAPSLSMTLSRL